MSYNRTVIDVRLFQQGNPYSSETGASTLLGDSMFRLSSALELGPTPNLQPRIGEFTVKAESVFINRFGKYGLLLRPGSTISEKELGE